MQSFYEEWKDDLHKKHVNWKVEESTSGGKAFKNVTFKGGEEIYSPFVTQVRGDVTGKVYRSHLRRSERAKTADESFNAPITTDEEKWRKNKNRYDYPGVDTIPEHVLEKRAQKFVKKGIKKGFVTKVHESSRKPERLHGQFFPSGIVKHKMVSYQEFYKDMYKSKEMPKYFKKRKKRVRLPVSGKPEIQLFPKTMRSHSSSKAFTLAHELGHAVDWSGKQFKQISPDFSNEFLGKHKEKGHKRMMAVSKQMRGGTVQASFSHSMYRSSGHEIFADVFASMILQPRATKRQDKELYSKMNKLIKKMLR